MQPRTLTIGLIFLIMTLTTTAQEAPESAKTLTTPVSPVSEAPKSVEKILNIDFSGGELMNLLEIIEEQNDITLNVIVSSEVREQLIPPLKLRNVHLGDLIEGLVNLGTFKVLVGGPNIFTVIPLPQSRRPSFPPGRRDTRDESVVTIHDISSLIADKNNTLRFSVSDIVTAVRIGWDMMPGKGAPFMKFHEETKLLIVRGTEAEQYIALNVLKRLVTAQQQQEPQKREEDKNRQLKKQVDILKVEVDNLKALVKHLQGINKMLQAKLDEAHKEINK